MREMMSPLGHAGCELDGGYLRFGLRTKGALIIRKNHSPSYFEFRAFMAPPSAQLKPTAFVGYSGTSLYIYFYFS